MLAEFDAINERGGVLGAMETGYQRGRIQDESMLYEHRNTTARCRSSASTPSSSPTRRLPRGRAGPGNRAGEGVAARRVREFQAANPAVAAEAIARLKEAAVSDQNVFAVLMDAARVCSLGQITEAFFEVGGQYRHDV